MTTTTATPSYTARINRILSLYAACRGNLTVFVPPRDHDRTTWGLPAGTTMLPPAALDYLADGFSLRFDATTRAATGPLDLPFVVALWRGIRGELVRDAISPTATRIYRKPADEDVARVRDGLARFLPPSTLIDGGDEVAALYALAAPLAIDHGPDRARDLLVRLAERVGADAEAVHDIAALSLPFAGRVRNWSELNLTTLEIPEPTPVYTAEGITAALATTAEPEPATLTRKRVRV